MSSTITWGRRDTLGSAWALMMARSQPAESPSATRFEELDDAALVAACVSGQTDAFDTIVQRHRRAVYQLCYRFVPHHEDASDLSQEVFLRAFRALHRFRGQSALGTWLHRIGVNACLNRVSAKVPRQETLDETDDRWLLASASESPVARVLHAERAVRMREFVSRLPGKQRATLILRVYQEMSHQEIAQVLGISVGAITLWNNGIARLGPSRASMYIYLVPVVTAVLGYVFLGEAIAAYHQAQSRFKARDRKGAAPMFDASAIAAPWIAKAAAA